MVVRVIALSICFLVVISGKSQADCCIVDLKNADGSFNEKRLYKNIYKDSDKNIYLLSESNHSFFTLDSIRRLLVMEIIRESKPDIVFYENTLEHQKLENDYLEGKLRLEDYKDTIPDAYREKYRVLKYLPHYPFYDELEREYNEIRKGRLLPFFKMIKQADFFDRMIPIDIATQTLRLGLVRLIKETKRKNLGADKNINMFLDSLNLFYKYRFVYPPLTMDNEETYSKYNKDLDDFILHLKENKYEPILIKTWENIFAVYHQANRYRELSVPLVQGGKELTLKESRRKNSFRDSVIYENFKFFLPNKWQNLIVMFSTFHLMDTRNYKDFEDVMDSSAKTLGKYLHNDYAPYLRRIAFICYDVPLKLPEYDNRHYKESLEYKLSKQYDYAYVDLNSYKNSPGVKQPFYMRPTFYTYRKLNWEKVFDGIVFIKDCGCSNKSAR